MDLIFASIKSSKNINLIFFESLNSKKLKKITLIFATLKNLNKHGFNFLQKNARAKKTRIHFFGTDRVRSNQSYIECVEPPLRGGSPFFENILINTSDPNIFVIIRKRKYERMF